MILQQGRSFVVSFDVLVSAILTRFPPLAALSGSIGIAPSSSLDPSRTSPSLFEPCHGAAFDIMGKDLANPVATFWSAAEMLRWLGEEKAADALMAAISVTLGKGETTGDLGGRMKTSEVVEATCRAIEKAA